VRLNRSAAALETAQHAAVLDKRGDESDHADVAQACLGDTTVVRSVRRSDHASPIRGVGWQHFASSIQHWRADEKLLYFAAYYIFVALCVRHTPSDAEHSVRSARHHCPSSQDKDLRGPRDQALVRARPTARIAIPRSLDGAASACD